MSGMSLPAQVSVGPDTCMAGLVVRQRLETVLLIAIKACTLMMGEFGQLLQSILLEWGRKVRFCKR